MQKIEYVIRGMGCGGCVNKVTTALKELPGVIVEKVVLGSATVIIDQAQTQSNQLIKKLGTLGFIAEQTPPF